MKTEDDLKQLRWIRIIDPVHIPRYLVEQVRDRDFTVDRFYQYQKIVCIDKEDGIIKADPCNLLYVIVDKSNKVQGFFWGVIDVLSNYLCINTFSMDKNWWGKGLAVNLLKEKCVEIKEGAQLDRIYWITRCPKHSERYGFKRSKSILMEYCGEETHGKNDEGQQSQTDGNSGSTD